MSEILQILATVWVLFTLYAGARYGSTPTVITLLPIYKIVGISNKMFYYSFMVIHIIILYLIWI